MLTLPFERGVWYSISELEAFRHKLIEVVQENDLFASDVRAPAKGAPRWIKTWNEELSPILHFGRHLSGRVLFSIMPLNDKLDVRLSVDDVFTTFKSPWRMRIGTTLATPATMTD